MSEKVEKLGISELKREAMGRRVYAIVGGQVEGLVKKETKDGKPFWELGLSDGQGKMTLRAWSDAPAYGNCENLAVGEFIEVRGEFAQQAGFGVDARRWTLEILGESAREILLAGSPETLKKQEEDYGLIEGSVRGMGDPRLRSLGELFLVDYGVRFRRCAAARGNHHARRGGLVEHVAQMMRGALGMAGAYPLLNKDLLIAGVLFHDAGKLWENAYPADGLMMPFDERGELLGHITIGVELVNTLWRKLLGMEVARGWGEVQPANEDVRLHLLHLVASHHGELQYGSPIVPKTPEAWALHYVDNLDAKLEMMAGGYANSKSLGPRIQERAWPLPGNLVSPLEKWSGEA